MHNAAAAPEIWGSIQCRISEPAARSAYIQNRNPAALTSLSFSYCLSLHTRLCESEGLVALGFGFFGGQVQI